MAGCVEKKNRCLAACRERVYGGASAIAIPRRGLENRSGLLSSRFGFAPCVSKGLGASRPWLSIPGHLPQACDAAGISPLGRGFQQFTTCCAHLSARRVGVLFPQAHTCHVAGRFRLRPRPVALLAMPGGLASVPELPFVKELGACWLDSQPPLPPRGTSAAAFPAASFRVRAACRSALGGGGQLVAAMGVLQQKLTYLSIAIASSRWSGRK